MDDQLIENNTNKRFGDTQSIPKLLLFGYGNPECELAAMIDVHQTDSDQPSNTIFPKLHSMVAAFTP